MKNTTAPPLEVKQPTTWIARVNLGRQMRDAGEKMVADALRERLDKVGEATWLKECESEWGWSRTTAYRHLNPELLQKDRDRQAALRSDDRNIEPVEPAKKTEPEPPIKTAGEMPSREERKTIREGVEAKWAESESEPQVESGSDGSFFSSRLTDFQKVTKQLLLAIKEGRQEGFTVNPEDYEKTTKVIEKVSVALETIAPRWQCQECKHVIVVEDGEEPEPIYECGECGESMKGDEARRCEQCNKFTSKICDEGCPEENCYGEVERVGWETVAEQLAEQAKESAAKEAEQAKQRAEQEKFEKSPAGKKAAAWREEEKAAQDARDNEDREDNLLELAAAIMKRRNTPLTAKEEKARAAREIEVGKIIEAYLPLHGTVTGGSDRPYRPGSLNPAPNAGGTEADRLWHEINCFTKAEWARYTKALSEYVSKQCDEPEP